MDLMITFWELAVLFRHRATRQNDLAAIPRVCRFDTAQLRLFATLGPGIRALGDSLVESGRSPIVAHLFFSHLHWDHIQGFPFFLPAYLAPNQFYIYGPRH